jgi:prevent-host-death family protein
MPKLDLSKGAKKDQDLLEAHDFVTVSQARAHFSDVVDLARSGKRVLVVNHGEPAAAFVPVSDLVVLDRAREIGLYDKLLALLQPK